jgi:hypothetical protein
VARIWARLLGVEPAGPEAHFFELGGHSLLAVQAHRDIRAELGAARLAITDIFRFPTLGALARRVEELAGVAPAPAPATLAGPAAGQASDRAPGPAPGPAPDPALDPRAAAMARRRELRERRQGAGTP